MPAIRQEFKSGARASVALCLVLSFVVQGLAASLPAVSPVKAGMSAQHLSFIDAAVEEAIGRKELPGAVVLVARTGGVVWRKAPSSTSRV
jgi:hypothetical protein